MALALDATDNEAQKLGATLEDAATNALTDFFVSGMTGAKSLGEAFRSMALTIVNAIGQVISQMIALKIMKTLLGLPFGDGGTVTRVEDVGYRAARGGPVVRLATGGIPRFAFPSGGRVSGRGGGTEDLIPAWLSHDEFVVRAAVVRRPGVREMLTRMNDGLALPALRGSQGPHRFADGGLVGAGGRAVSTSGEVSGQINVGLEDGLVLRALETPKGQRLVIQALAAHPRAARRAQGL
jgi:hypothetical protein